MADIRPAAIRAAELPARTASIYPAAFAKALGDEGISANVIAGFYHDHILVQWARAGDAMAASRRLSDA